MSKTLFSRHTVFILGLMKLFILNEDDRGLGCDGSLLYECRQTQGLCANVVMYCFLIYFKPYSVTSIVRVTETMLEWKVLTRFGSGRV